MERNNFENIPDEVQKELNRSVYRNRYRARFLGKCTCHYGCARNTDDCSNCPYAVEGTRVQPYCKAFPTDEGFENPENNIADPSDFVDDFVRKNERDRLADMIESRIPMGKAIWNGVIVGKTFIEIACELGVNERTIRRKIKQIREESGIKPEDLKFY